MAGRLACILVFHWYTSCTSRTSRAGTGFACPPKAEARGSNPLGCANSMNYYKYLALHQLVGGLSNFGLRKHRVAFLPVAGNQIRARSVVLTGKASRIQVSALIGSPIPRRWIVAFTGGGIPNPTIARLATVGLQASIVNEGQYDIRTRQHPGLVLPESGRLGDSEELYNCEDCLCASAII